MTLLNGFIDSQEFFDLCQQYSISPVGTDTETIPPLTLSRTTITMDAGDSQHVTISGGSGDYTVSSNNTQTAITILQGDQAIISDWRLEMFRLR